jgi:hypothetical protein
MSRKRYIFQLRTLLGLCLFAPSCGAEQARAPIRPVDARSTASDARPDRVHVLLQQVNEAYASCGSYKDAGTVVAKYFRKGRLVDQETVRFSTEFARPAQLRFAFVIHNDAQKDAEGVIWTEGGLTKSRTTLEPSTIQCDSLGEGLYGVTGITHSSAQYVPKLLIPNEVRGRKVTELQSPALIGAKSIGKQKCWVVSGSYAPNQPLELWIGQTDHRIHRLIRTLTLSDKTTVVTTVSYNAKPSTSPRKPSKSPSKP